MRKHLAVAVLPLALAACGDAGPSASPTRTVTVSPSPSAPAASPGSDTSGVGEVWDDGVARMTVLEVRQKAPGNSDGILDPGVHWSAALARVCIPTASGVTVSQLPWSASSEEGGIYESAGGPDYDRLNPLYPIEDAQVFPGRCAKGWVYFEVPDGVQIALVIHSDDGSAHGWTV